ncbi:MAG: class I SAM-dependent methyltransferase [Methylophilaceae bacterium]|nr:class I SAM-dependent methyltransferase [Methyloradius sp.]
MPQKPILIFPGGMPRSVAYLNKLNVNEDSREVIGASSLAYDPAREYYASWVWLPYVTDPAFDEALQRLITEFNIGEIYTPNHVVWGYLEQHLGRLAKGVLLANTSPVDEVLGGYRAALKKAESFAEKPLALSIKPATHPMPSIIELAGLCRYTDLIPGMCDDEKFHVLLEIARHSVKGDIVEIGSWWGKSAFILAWLAPHFQIGNLLCVDPWSNAHLIQNETIVDSCSAQVDADEAFNVFRIGILPFNAKHINYLRMASEDGARSYSDDRVVRSEYFGETRYAGKISILHIDGNHAYEAVKADIDSWGGFVVDGGWIIFDDYMWPYGDGPKKIGDDFIDVNQSRIANAFTMGGALFIQLMLSNGNG